MEHTIYFLSQLDFQSDFLMANSFLRCTDFFSNNQTCFILIQVIHETYLLSNPQFSFLLGIFGYLFFVNLFSPSILFTLDYKILGHLKKKISKGEYNPQPFEKMVGT